MVDAGGGSKIYIPFTPGLELEEHLFTVAFTCLGRIGEGVKWHIYMDFHDVNYPL